MGRIRKPFTLFKRGSVWYYRTYDRDGYRTSAKSTGCTSKMAATKYCEQLQLSGGLNRTNITFSQYSKDFFAPDSIYVRDRTRSLSMNTVNRYRLNLKNRLLPYFGKMCLSDITVSVIKTYRVTLIDEGLTGQTINLILYPLSAILKAAYLDDIIQNNPFNKIPSLEENKKETVPYTLEEIRKISETIINYKNFILLITLTGMRAGEAIGLTEEDIKVSDTGTLYIDLKQQYDTRQKMYTECKWNSSRKIPIIPEIKELISPFLPYSTLYSALNAALDKLGIKENRAFHAFRHYFISDTKSKNINPLKVEYIAGHSLRGMEKVYTHMDFQQMEEILEWQKKTFDLLTR